MRGAKDEEMTRSRCDERVGEVEARQQLMCGDGSGSVGGQSSVLPLTVECVDGCVGPLSSQCRHMWCVTLSSASGVVHVPSV